MKKVLLLILFVFIFFTNTSYAGLLDGLIKGITPKKELDDQTIISGLKEALSVGTDKAVKEVSQLGGYFGNQMIKILVPEKIQKGADALRKVGFHKQVDDFILSMNPAARVTELLKTVFGK